MLVWVGWGVEKEIPQQLFRTLLWGGVGYGKGGSHFDVTCFRGGMRRETHHLPSSCYWDRMGYGEGDFPTALFVIAAMAVGWGIGRKIPQLHSSCYYTGWPPKTWNSWFFLGLALINSYPFTPCWIEHLFLIIITPRSSNLVEKFLFYE